MACVAEAPGWTGPRSLQSARRHVSVVIEVKPKLRKVDGWPNGVDIRKFRASQAHAQEVVPAHHSSSYDFIQGR